VGFDDGVPDVGLVGLGNMGQGIAHNLLKPSTAPLKVLLFNRTREKAATFIDRGAILCESLSILAAEADIVLACLANVQASEELFLHPISGLLNVAKPNQIFVDHGTVSLDLSLKCGEAAKTRGAFFLDAPISGGPEGAAAGTLSIMVGGDAIAFQRCAPVFERIGKTVIHMGTQGTGTLTKIINQMLTGIHTVASCEAALFASHAGINLTSLLKVLNASYGGSRMIQRNFPIIEASAFSETGAPLRLLLKDFDCARAAAEHFGGREGLVLTNETHKLLAQAVSSGLAQSDISSLFVLLSKI